MNENYEGEELDNIVILNDEDGNEVKFEFLDLVELDDEEYVVLLPVTVEGEEEEGRRASARRCCWARHLQIRRRGRGIC